MNGTASTSILTGEPTDYESGGAPKTFRLPRLPRASWLAQVGVAAGSMTIALALTHALWGFAHHTPYFLGFLAAIVSSRVGGRQAGFLAAFVGVLGYLLVPLPMPADEFQRPLIAFLLISAAFSWLVARRYEVEGALRASEARLSEAQQVANIGSWEWNVLDGRETWSDEMYRILGVKVNSVTPCFETFSRFQHADDRVRVDQVVRQACVGHRPFQCEHRIIRPDGDVRTLHVQGRIVLNEQQVIRIVGTAQDITDRKRLEEQLRQSQKMEAIGQLAGGIAHDFNNLLTAILGYSELLTGQIGPDKPIGQDLQEIRSAAQRAAALTRQLLAFSRKQVLRLTLIDVNAVVRDIEGMLSRLIGERIRITTALAEDLHAVIADASQLEQVLVNLAVNARDAMPNGGTLIIRTANAESYAADQSPAIVLTLTDTGTGISPAVQARMFEPFFTTKERGKGTGLGLAAVHGIVTQLGGSIAVESTPNRGTSFTIRLPATGGAVVPVTGSAVRPGLPVGTETVLLVEDEPAVRAFTRTALERVGHRVLDAASAEEALEVVAHERGPIHLLLTDVVLPKMDGRELAKRFALARPGVQVLFMSGYTDLMSTADGFLEPDLQFIAKPFTAPELLAKIRQQLMTHESPYSAAER